MICLPYLGILVYLVAERRGMGKHRLAEVQAAQSQMDAHVRSRLE